MFVIRYMWRPFKASLIYKTHKIDLLPLMYSALGKITKGSRYINRTPIFVASCHFSKKHGDVI